MTKVVKYMANSLLQVRIDENLRRQAAEIYTQLGLDLPTAIRIFLTRSVQVRGIPFSMQLPSGEYKAAEAVAAMKRMSQAAEEKNISYMSLQDINKEIEAVRNSHK